MAPELSYRFIEDIKALPFVEAVYLFGSRARGDGQERSDIDLAVKLQKNAAANQWHEVLEIVEEADTLLEIDCVNLDEVAPEFLTRILQQGRRL